MQKYLRFIGTNSSTNIQGLVLLSANEIQVKGHIHANERGFRGGTVGTASNKNGGIGESYVAGKWNTRSTNGQYGSGGGGVYQKSNGDTGLSGARPVMVRVEQMEDMLLAVSSKRRYCICLKYHKRKIFISPKVEDKVVLIMQIHTIQNQHVKRGSGGGIVIIDAIYCELTSSQCCICERTTRSRSI